MRRLVAVLVALVTTLGTLPVAASPPATESTDVETFETTVKSFDGHEVPVKVYNSTSQDPSPTLLWGHGWGGSYADSDGDGELFAREGYNVVAMDFRGHGQARASSQAHVHSPDVEIRDVRHVIDWVAQQDFAELEVGVETDRPGGDPVLGALGGSYGGGYQLLTAAQDDRLDAIAPEITWNSLPQSLAPNGAIKSTWVDALYAAGVAQANLAPFIHQGYAWGTATNEFPDGELPGEPDVEGNFTASSPASYPNAIDVPTLLIQGNPDVLFPMNQAIANARQIADAGSSEVKLLTHDGGHVVNTNGTLGADQFDVGIQHPAGASPCGPVDHHLLRWYDDHLKDAGDDAIPTASIALDEDTCATGPDVVSAVFEDPVVETASLGDVLLPQGPPVVSGFAQAEEEIRVASPVQRTALEPAETTTVAGIPTLTGDITVHGTQAIVYVSLVAETAEGERVVDDQVMPLRQPGPVEDASFTFELAGVGEQLQPGDTLKVEFSTTHPMYGDNGNRQPGVVVLENLELDLPTAS